MRTSLLLLALASATSFATAANTDWNRFRGPNGSGTAATTGLPATFEKAQIGWMVSVPFGWSSPVPWGDKVILTAETAADKRAVLCLSAADGSKVWEYEVPFKEHRQHKFNSFASSTPFVDADRIYITWTSGTDVQALALNHDGKLLWHREGIANYVHEHGSGVSPVVADGVLIVRAEFATEKKGTALAEPEQMDWKSQIVGLDAATGKDLWRREVPNTFNPYSTPTVRQTAAGAEFLVANTTSGFMGLDVKTGKINWQHNPGYQQRSVGGIVLEGDTLFACLGSGGGGKESAILKVSASGPEEVAVIKDAPLPYVPSPLLVGDRLYLLNDGGIFTAVKWPSGEPVYEPQRLSSAKGRSTKYFSSPVAADGKIFCCSQTGDVVTVKQGDAFEVLGVTELDAPINASPAISDDALYIRTEKSLYRINASGGKLP
ncbi:MAG: PQQ-binding-like beta-propeller repeat protein [Verrucomicrobiales bacterium]|nr:PQQ-binding-like beta-propeller repeat protein [Verrucomicrobiales bacterium]